MSVSTRNRPAKAENPFEIFATAAATPKRALQKPQQARIPKRPVPWHSAPPVISQPRYPAVPVQRAQPAHASLRAAHRSRLSAPGLLKSVMVVGLALLLVFILLPDAMQKRCFALLGLRAWAPITSTVSVPVPYAYISSPFGRRWGRRHQGIDLAAPYAAPIYAASAGKVIHSGWESGYGNSIVIDHGNGMQTRYAHCSRLLVAEGAMVEKGALIAKVGSTGHSTGPHLHFEVIVNGVRKNPVWYYAFPESAAHAVQAQLAKAAN